MSSIALPGQRVPASLSAVARLYRTVGGRVAASLDEALTAGYGPPLRVPDDDDVDDIEIQLMIALNCSGHI